MLGESGNLLKDTIISARKLALLDSRALALNIML